MATKEPQILRPLFGWRSAIASAYGPSKPTTRHVLLTLALHMSVKGDSCFPSIDTLTVETGLSRRAVVEHLLLAHTEGWIDKRERLARNGQGWKRMEYFARIPDNVVAKLQNDQELEGGAPGALPLGGAPGSEGGAPDSTNAVHQVHLSTSVNSSENSTGDEKPARAPSAGTKSRKITLPEGFKISDSVKAWAAKNGHTPAYLQQCFDAFVDDAGAHGRTYVNWDLALQGWVRRQPQFERNGSMPTAAKAAAPRRNCEEPGCKAEGKYGVLGKLYCVEHFHPRNDAALAQRKKPAGATT